MEDGKWKMRSEVVALKALSGDHGGENLGRYFIGCANVLGLFPNQDQLNVHMPSSTVSLWTTLHQTTRSVKQSNVCIPNVGLLGVLRRINYCGFSSIFFVLTIY